MSLDHVSRGAAGNADAARCGACQLQLCKSRDESPHARLRESAGDGAARQTVYRCEDCGATLIHSHDTAAAGWALPRRAPALARTETPGGAR